MLPSLERLLSEIEVSVWWCGDDHDIDSWVCVDLIDRSPTLYAWVCFRAVVVGLRSSILLVLLPNIL